MLSMAPVVETFVTIVPARCRSRMSEWSGSTTWTRTASAPPIIVAIRKRDGTFDTTPSPDELIEAGDVLIGVGTPQEIRKLEDFFAPREAVAH